MYSPFMFCNDAPKITIIQQLFWSAGTKVRWKWFTRLSREVIGEGGVRFTVHQEHRKGYPVVFFFRLLVFDPSCTQLQLTDERDLFVCAGPNLGGGSGSTSILLVLNSGVLYLTDEPDLFVCAGPNEVPDPHHMEPDPRNRIHMSC